MSRFYSPPENIKDNLIYIYGQEAKHILNVMRLKEKDAVVVFDGTGKEYTGFIKETKTKELVVEVVKTRLPKKEDFPDITLAQALPKKDKMDHVVEKATELGVSNIVPLISERTVIKFEEEKARAREERWRKIAKAAAKQCGRLDVPGIKSVQKFYNFMDEVEKFDFVLMACLTEGSVPFKDALSGFEAGSMLMFIGPEGDFTENEIFMAKNAGAKLISFGKRVLKSDTAALYALSVLTYELAG